jgi:hypothetical protein
VRPGRRDFPAAVTDATVTVTGLSLSATGGTGYGGPVLSGVIAMDDWTSYADDTAFLASLETTTVYQSDSVNVRPTAVRQLAHIDTAVTYAGHQTCRYDLPENSSEVPQLVGKLPASYGDIWLDTVVRYSPGFTITGSPQTGAYSYKLGGFGLTTGAISGRVIWISTNGYGSPGGPSNGGDIQVEHGRGTAGWDLGFLSPNTRSFAPLLNDGNWYRFRMHYKVLGNRTVIRTWIFLDGTTPTDFGLVDVAHHRVPPLQAYSVLLNRNFNNNRPAGAGQALWWGEWKAIDGNINPDPFGYGIAENMTRLFDTVPSVTSLSVARGASGSVVFTRNATGDWVAPKFRNSSEQAPPPTAAGSVLAGTGVTLTRGADNTTATTETVTFNVSAGATPGTYVVPIYTACYDNGYKGARNVYNDITLTVT